MAQEEYVRDHKIPELIDELLAKILREQPQNPRKFLYDQLKRTESPVQQSLDVAPPSIKVGKRLSILDEPAASTNSADPLAASTGSQHLQMKHKGPKSIRQEFFSAFATTRLSEHGSVYNLASPTSQGGTGIIRCRHFGALALGLSFLLGGGHKASREKIVTIEDIFVTLNLPLHYLSNTAMTLSELYDIARAYIREDSRFAEWKCSVIHLDIKHRSESGEAAADSSEGDRGPVLTLSQFRECVENMSSTLDGVQIVNYDPIECINVETAAKVLAEEDVDYDIEESINKDRALEDVDAGIAVDTGNSKRKHQGAFAVVVGYNVSLAETDLAEPIFTTGGLKVVRRTVLLKTLHRSLCERDTFTYRPRGFLQFTKTSSEARVNEHTVRVSSVFANRLLAGTGMHGTRLLNVSPMVSPHLIGVAFAIHLLNGETEDGHGQLGVDVGDIVRTLHLPMSVVVNNKMPLRNVFDYTLRFLDYKGINSIQVSYHPVLTRSAYDSGTNLSVADLENMIVQMTKQNSDPHRPQSVILLNFDVNIAHGVLGLDHGAVISHYGVVTGIDVESGIVSIADVMPKKFKKYWKTPIIQLHSAIVGRGMLLFSRVETERGSTPTKRGPRVHIDGSLRLELVPNSHDLITSFNYPQFAACFTSLAVALWRLGHQVSATQVATLSTFDINFLFGDLISIFDLQRIADNFIANELGGTVFTKVDMFDIADSIRSEAQFVEYLLEKKALEANGTTVHIIEIDPYWLLAANGEEFGGYFAQIVAIDPQSEGGATITLSDVNELKYYRTWKVKVAILLDCLKMAHPVSRRGRGILTLSKTPLMTVPTTILPFNMSRTTKARHPFKLPVSTHLQVTAFALSELGIATSAENVLYQCFREIEAIKDNMDHAEHADRIPGADFTFDILKGQITIADCCAMVKDYVSKLDPAGEKFAAFKAEPISDLAALPALVADSVQSTGKFLVVVVFDAPTLHRLASSPAQLSVGTAIIQGWLDEAVYLADSSPTRYGAHHVVAASALHEAIKYSRHGGAFRLGYW